MLLWAQQHGLLLTSIDAAAAMDEGPACQQQGQAVSASHGKKPWRLSPATPCLRLDLFRPGWGSDSLDMLPHLATVLLPALLFEGLRNA